MGLFDVSLICTDLDNSVGALHKNVGQEKALHIVKTKEHLLGFKLLLAVFK